MTGFPCLHLLPSLLDFDQNLSKDYAPEMKKCLIPILQHLEVIQEET